MPGIALTFSNPCDDMPVIPLAFLFHRLNNNLFLFLHTIKFK
jgi:hypothetical protein